MLGSIVKMQNQYISNPGSADNYIINQVTEVTYSGKYGYYEGPEALKWEIQELQDTIMQQGDMVGALNMEIYRLKEEIELIKKMW